MTQTKTDEGVFEKHELPMGWVLRTWWNKDDPHNGPILWVEAFPPTNIITSAGYWVRTKQLEFLYMEDGDFTRNRILRVRDKWCEALGHDFLDSECRICGVKL